VTRLLVQGARVHNGESWLGPRDVLVADGRIAAISPTELTVPDAVTVPGAGLVLSPGFIDVHNMTRRPAQLLSADGINLLAQGVTTTVIGNCGMSGEYESPDEVVSRVEELRGQPLALNVGALMGHGSVRQLVNDHGPLSPGELAELTGILERGLAAGALGVSLGLMYAPGWHADADELATIARTLGEHDRVLAVHLRSEGDGVADAVDEIVSLAQYCTVVLLHLKACGPRNWPDYERISAAVHAGAERTGRLYATYYPYTHTNTALRALIPQAAGTSLSPGFEAVVEREGLQTLTAHGWSDVLLIGNVSPELIGTSLADRAQRDHSSPVRALLDTLAEFPDARAIFRGVAVEADVRRTATWPFALPASDGYVFSTGEHTAEHPRNYGAIVGSLLWAAQAGRDLGEVIRSLTSLPADVYRIPDRGRLIEGGIADLTVFDPSALAAPADMHDPSRLAEGIVATVVSGQLAYEYGAVTGHRGGSGLVASLPATRSTSREDSRLPGPAIQEAP